MSVLNSEAFHEGVPSGLQLFDLPPTQVGVNNVTYQEIRPSSQVTDGGPIEFVINTNNSVEYIDLKGSQLYVKVKVPKADGCNLTKNEKLGQSTYFYSHCFHHQK